MTQPKIRPYPGKLPGWEWDNGTARNDGSCLSVNATQSDLRLVASYLLRYAMRWPDDELGPMKLKKSVFFDKELREAAQHIGVQLLGIPDDCSDVEGDMACCVSVPDIIETQGILSDMQEGYDEHQTQFDIDGLDTLAPLVGPGADQGFVDKVMCAGLKLFMQAMVNTLRAQKQQKTQDRVNTENTLAAVFGGLGSVGGAALTLGGAGAAAVAFFGGPWMLLALAVSAVALTGIAALERTDLSLLEDTQAFDKVFCEWANNFIGAELNFYNFSHTFPDGTSEVFEIGSNAAKLAVLLQPFTQDQTLFIELAIALNGYATIAGDLLPEADCGCMDTPVIVLEAIPGYPEVKLVATNALWAEYRIKTQYTGNYSVGGARSVGGVPFYMHQAYEDPEGFEHTFVPPEFFGFAGEIVTIDDIPGNVTGSEIVLYNYGTPGLWLVVRVGPAPA